MSIQTEIDRIENNVAATYSVLNDLGADMPSEQNSDNLRNTAASIKAVRYDSQTLTEEQKSQARSNIGAASTEEVSNLPTIHYGVCETASDVADKVVTVSDENFELKEGAVIIVRFINSNGIASPTLNVNGTGAKPIYRYGTTAASTATTTTGWTTGAIQLFVYSGVGWVRDYWSNTTYSNVALGQGYATCSTAAATVAKTASLSSYTLTANGIVSVRFTNDVPANATLNINSKGAKAIYFNNAKITDGVIKAGDTATFIYNSYYRLISIDRWQNDIDTLTNSISELSREIADLSLGLNDDGRLYLLKNGVAQGNGIELPVGESGDVTGNIGANNKVILTGNIPDGTYSFAFEMEDGSIVDIGDLVKGAIKPTYNNILTSGKYTVELNKRWSNSALSFSSNNGMIGFLIPIADVSGKTIRFKGFPVNTTGANSSKAIWYALKSDYSRASVLAGTSNGGGCVWESSHLQDLGNGVYAVPVNDTTFTGISSATYIAINMAFGTSTISSIPSDVIMTIDEEIV